MLLTPANFCKTDVLVIGQGGAGLMAALSVKDCGLDVLVCGRGKGATPSITGLNIVDGKLPGDLEHYREDVIAGGEQINQRELVDALALGAVQINQLLDSLHIPLARSQSGYAKRRLSGSSYPRSVYCAADNIGRCLWDALCLRAKKAGIKFLSPLRICRLIKYDEGYWGAMGIDGRDGSCLLVIAQAIILATGGIGRLYPHSTYPDDVIGDGYYLGYQCGCQLVDMEFVQFEPTIMVYPPECNGVVVPTAMLGDGAVLRNRAGERFMQKYNPEQGELSQKHTIAFAIAEEIRAGRGTDHGAVYFDATDLAPRIIAGYSELIVKCESAKIDVTKTYLEVAPVAHSMMGGIVVDPEGKTSIPGLFAAGEVTGGIHGANRIAGNGGTEILAFGSQVGLAAALYVKENNIAAVGDAASMCKNAGIAVAEGTMAPQQLKVKVQEVVNETAGLIRSDTQLSKGLQVLENIEEKGIPNLQVGNMRELAVYLDLLTMVATAKMIIGAALLRKETRGFHFRCDYPNQSENMFNIVLSKAADGTMTFTCQGKE
ncbi:MAG: FAD-binding protein [bacterium]|jgi:succinate dehydrogenase/fumarate reductase flavoprotein subunit